MEFEKKFDHLFLPVSCNVCGSFSDNATDSLGFSQDSSKFHLASSESWMSESSCDCHSPRQPVMQKSQIMFYNQSILPPLLCSSARVDMQLARRKAIQNENKRQERSNHLIYTTQFNPTENENAKSVIEMESAVKNVCLLGGGKSSEEISSASPLALVDSDLILGNSSVDLPSKPLDVDSGLHETSFQESAYRSSLQNLLHKSVNINKSSNVSSSLDNIISQNASNAKDCGDAQTTLAPEIISCKGVANDADSDASAKVFSSQNMESCDKNKTLESQINKIAENLVNSVIEGVKLELHSSPAFQSSNTDSTCQPLQNCDELPLKSCSIQCPYFSPRSAHTSSPCRATKQINKALNLLESEFSLPSKSHYKASDTFSSPESPIQTEASFLYPVDLQNSGSPAFCRKSKSSLLNTSSHISSETEPELDAEEQQLSCAEQENDTMMEPTASYSNPCSPSLIRSEDRVRKGSFSVDTPSSLLLSSRSTHTIYSEVKNRQSEVKRRLDMRSESDDSLLSTAITDASMKSFQVKQKVDIPNFYKLIEEQHKNEMLELQQHHHKQLQEFKQKFLNCQLFSPQQLCIDTDVENCGVSNDHVDLELHRKWCKLSALVKGHLTRMLLRSLPVQSCMKTIRDTSRTILSMRSEDTSQSTNMSAIQDATLMNRLFSQLKAAMFQFHTFFFNTPVFEQIDMIKRTQDAEAKSVVLKVINRNKVPRLSAATLKSLQRKKDSRNSQKQRHRIPSKEVKSKVSSIWKTNFYKKAPKDSKKSSDKSASVKHSYCEVESPLSAWKHHEARENIAF